MTTKQLGTQQALDLALADKLTESHILVTYGEEGVRRHCAKGIGESGEGLRFWIGDDWLTYADLKAILYTGCGYVELETPSPFDDEAFKEWEHYAAQDKMCANGKYADLTMDKDGIINVRGKAFHEVPVARIPEAVRHINALLALGEK